MRIPALTAAGIVSAFLSVHAHADNLIVGLSPFGEADAAKDRAKHLLAHVIETTGPGEDAVFIDAYRAKTLCRYAVPDKAAYARPKAAVKVNGACVKAVLGFAEAPGEDTTAGAIRMPHFMRFVAGNFDMDRYKSILVAGSPIYHDPLEPRFTMRAARVPSHAHITATRQASPYSVAGYGGLLPDTPVHLVSPSADWKLNDGHGAMVRCFWTLHTETMGGRLASFGSDLKLALQRVGSGTVGASPACERDSSDKLEMMPVRIERFAGPSLYDREVSEDAPAPELVRTAQNVQVGIRWQDCEACDLDIYVRPYNGAEVLYFGHTHSREGAFYKDFRSAPTAAAGLESVSFREPVDLGKLLVAVNLYSGNAPQGVNGEVRIAIGAETYAAPFRIEAQTGNRGAGAQDLLNAGTVPNEQWAIIDPMKVLGLR